MIHIDWETFGEVELRGKNSVGLHNYFCHPKTELLTLAWAYDDEPPEGWEIHNGYMPDKLRRGLEDPKELLAAWNSTFERYGFWYKMDMKIPIERFVDPQASARYLSLPPDLETVGQVLGLPPEMIKDSDGERLLDIFSKPQIVKKKGQPIEYRRRDWNTDPEDWAKLCDYNKQDIVAEREIMRRLKDIYKVFPLPEREQRIWVMDQRINDRGIPVDRKFVEMGLKLATREKNESLGQQNVRTGLANANSRNQLLAWAKTQGYAKNTLKKGTVDAELKFNDNLTPLCREILEARKDGGSTSYKKLDAILRRISSDGRLRNQFVYMGSSRCGRWSGSGGGVQMQNLARPNQAFEDVETLTEARNMVINGDYDRIRERYGSVLTTVKYCLRTSFLASPGKRFDVADLNAIETRVGAWVTGCTALTKVFEQNRDPYLDYASKITQIPYENLARDLKSKDPAVKARAKALRQMAKPVVLGCIYRLGGGSVATIKGDPTKTGLWGYAEGYGVAMTQEEAANHVRIFRDSYPEIPQFWYACEDAIKDVLAGTRTVREIGPNGCIRIDKINLEGRDPVLRIQLPSGRYLHYVDASIQNLKMPWKDREGNDVYRDGLVYSGTNQETHQWDCGVTSHGGKITENIIQGIARDVIAEDMLQCEVIEISINAHAHDEIIAENEDSLCAPGLIDMEAIMAKPINWLPGLLLKGEGFSSSFYRKG